MSPSTSAIASLMSASVIPSSAMASAAFFVGAIRRIMLFRSRVPALLPTVPESCSTASMVSSSSLLSANCIVEPIFSMASPNCSTVPALLLAAYVHSSIHSLRSSNWMPAALVLLMM